MQPRKDRCGAVRLADPEPVQAVRLAYFDHLQRTFPRDWQDLPVRVRCEQCGAETDALPNRLLCGACGDFRTQLLSGDEMLLASLELTRAPEVAPEPEARRPAAG